MDTKYCLFVGIPSSSVWVEIRVEKGLQADAGRPAFQSGEAV
jgi:hypothetical protein